MLDAKDLEMISEAVIKAVEPVRKDVEKLQESVSAMRGERKEIRQVLDEGVIKGIHVIAEGNMDLRRRMNQILESGVERELMKLKVQRLENEIKRLKEKFDIA